MTLKRFGLVLLVLLMAVVALVPASAQDAAPVIDLTTVDPLDPATFGLDPARPFDGTTLNLLSCCNTAPQFASLRAKTDEEFTAMTGITVTWGDLPFAAFQQQLVLEATAGTGDYDMAFWVDAWGASIRDFILPLNDYLAASDYDFDERYPAAFTEASRLGSEDGTVYGIPLRGHVQMLFYRTDVFEELGLDVPTTWQEVAAAAQAIEENTDLSGIAMYYGINADQNLFNWYSHLWGAGADIIDADFRPAFNTSEGVEATRAYVGLLRDLSVTSEGATTWNEQEANQEMVQGRAAMFVGWWWMYPRLANSETAQVADNVGFAPAPGWEGGTTSSYGYIWPIGILADSRQPDAAWEYIRWVTHPVTEKRVAVDESNPAFLNNVVVQNALYEDPDVNALHDNIHGVAAEILRDARTIPLVPEYLEFMPVLAAGINEIALGADVEATLARMAADVEAIMQRAGYYD